MEKKEQQNEEQKHDLKPLTKYEVPTKKLKSPMDLGRFVKGKSYIKIMTFIADL